MPNTEITVTYSGIKVTFSKYEHIPEDREEEFFWVKVEGNFPYILEERLLKEKIDSEEETEKTKPKKSIFKIIKHILK